MNRLLRRPWLEAITRLANPRLPHSSPRTSLPSLSRWVRSPPSVPECERPARILLLTSSLGSGHVRAAQAIEYAVRKRLPGAVVRTLDFWALMDGRVAWVVRSAYLRLVQENAGLFDRLYQLEQRTWRKVMESKDPPPEEFAEVLALIPPISFAADVPPDTPQITSDRIYLRLLCMVLAGTHRGGRLLRMGLVRTAWNELTRRLVRQIVSFDPDTIIATQMNSAGLLSFARRDDLLNVPTIGVPTDFGIHDFWAQPGIDHYFVAHESIAEARDSRVWTGDFVATGIPLMPGFRQPPSTATAREELGLSPDLPVVLVAGGGLGLGVDCVAARLLQRRCRMQLLVVTGRNSGAQQALSVLSACHENRLKVCEWTEHMELFMRAADVVVGKPGGLTVAEALACGRPLLATRSLGGQENFNVRFLERHCVGRLVPEADLPETVEALLSDPIGLARMKERAWSLGKRESADRIADLVTRLSGRRHANKIAGRHG
ncbi:MAG: glycosyltransferase [Prolixibacteraceae bacterium]|nr:glycosyltransferase [Burkholderiales bacterium]